MPAYPAALPLTGGTLLGDLTTPNLFIALGGQLVIGADAALYRPAAGILAAAGPLRAERAGMAAQYLQLDGGDSNGTRISAEYTSQKYLRINNNGAAGVVTTATIQFALGNVLTLAIAAGDKLLFGSAQDVNLYRAAGALATDNQLMAQLNSSTLAGLVVGIPAATDGVPSASIMLRGLGVDHNFITSVPSGTAATRRIRFGRAPGSDFTAAVGFISLAGDDRILFGSAEDTNLYRSAASTLATTSRLDMRRNGASYGAVLINPHASADGLLVQLGNASGGALMACLTGDTANRWYVTGDGRHYWGPGGSTDVDTNLYRSAADTLATDDAMTVGGVLTISNATPRLSFYVAGVTERGFIQYNPATPALRIDSDENIQLAPANTVAITIDNAGKVIFGAALDTVLYRAAAGKLQTDGAFAALGGFITPLSTKTADYALTASDGVILANAALTATLPSAVTAGAGRQYTVKNRHASATVTLASAAGTIDGVATLSIGPMEAITAVSDGANWWAI